MVLVRVPLCAAVAEVRHIVALPIVRIRSKPDGLLSKRAVSRALAEVAVGVIAESAQTTTEGVVVVEVRVDAVGGGNGVCSSLCDVAIELLGATSADDGRDDEEAKDKTRDANDSECACDSPCVTEEPLAAARRGGRGCSDRGAGGGLEDG